MGVLVLMFKKLTMRNFMSFKDTSVDLCVKKDSPPNYTLFYGENGAGKSNLIQSVSFLKESVTTMKAEKLFSANPPNIPAEMIPRMPNLADIFRVVKTVDSTENMYLCYEMSVHKRNTVYEMEFSDNELIREELHTSLGKKTGLLYSIENKNGRKKIYMADKFVKDPRFKDELMQQIPRFWGKNSFLAILDLMTIDTNPEYLEDNVMYVYDIISYIESIQVSVAPIFGQVRCDPYPFLANLESGIIKKTDEHALRAYEKALNRFFRRLYHNVTKVHYELSPSGDMIRYRLLFDRKMDGRVVTIPSVMESNGTRKLVSIFNTLITCSSDGIAFIDEMDSGVHDKLICDLLSQTLPEVGGQLIITTHNTELLKHVPPKNVFVIDVDSDGYKEVRNFNKTVRTQTNNNNQTRYMNNAVGGIPFIGIVDLKGIAEELREGLSANV